MVRSLINQTLSMKIWRDTGGQDMLEYACFIAAICLMYAAVSPQVASSISTIFSKIASTMSNASGTS